MAYTVQQLATLSGVTVRTLHHYDAIRLLKPARIEANGYRSYGEAELLKLQQIMFFRELDFTLKDILQILSNPSFDMATALSEHRKLIEIKKKRMDDLIATIDKTLEKVNHQKTMDDKDLYGGFSKEEWEAYTKEAKQLWGERNVDVSIKKFTSYSPEERQKWGSDGEALMQAIVAKMHLAPESPEVQELIAKHYDSLHIFYEPNLILYRNLANLYVDDARFTAHFDKFDKGLAAFMHNAMLAYCDANE